VVWDFASGEYFEWFTELEITRTRNFYYKDSEGIFHLPDRNPKLSWIARQPGRATVRAKVK
jgi:hypothetical protein